LPEKNNAATKLQEINFFPR